MAGTLGTIMGQVRLDIRQAVASYAALRAQNARTTYALRGTGDSFVQAGQRMTLAGGAMVYGFAKVVQAAAEFERKMDYAAAVSNTTGEQMQKLSDYALQLGQDTIYSAGEIADGFIELAKAGVSARDIMHGVGEAMATLGAAGDIPLAQSGQIITSTVQQFNLAADDAVRVTDLLAGAANASIADISDIGVSLKYVGGVANAAGLSLEDTTTAISLLAKAGIRGSTAGTSLRQMIVSLGGATGPATDALTELGIITADGNNKFFDAEGNAKSLSQVFQILQGATADLTNKQRLMYLRTIFNNRALSAASILTRDGAKGFREMNREMSKTTAAEVASKRLDNLSGDIEILQGNIETLMIKAGSPFQEEMRNWVQGLTKLVQAFGNLDPKTQEMILRTIGMTGVLLTAMGIFNIILGTIFRFAASVLKLAAGMKFLFNILKIVVVNARWAAIIFGGPLMAALTAAAAAIGVTVGVLLLIIAAIVAVVVALVILYKKWEPFRSLVNSFASALWSAIKAIGAFFKALVTDPGKAWDMLKKGMSQLGKWAGQLGQLIWDGLKKGLSYVGDFVTGAVQWFLSLPGKAISALLGFVSQVVQLFTFRNVGYALGFLLGTIVRIFLQMGIKMASLALSAVTKVIGFFAKLPGRVGYFIGFMLGKAVGLMIRLQARMIALAAKILVGVVKFFAKLPGRVINFVTNMVTRGVAMMINFAQRLPSLAAQLVTGVANFIAKLPGRVANFIVNMVNRGRTLFTQFKTVAVNIAKGMATGFENAIKGLPGLVAGIAGDIVQAFRDQITSAANAVKDFASGMWNGFKDGIGMHSPSYFERAMWQITGTMDKETKKLAKKTMDIQRMSKRLAATSFTVGDPGAPSSAEQYRRLASTHRANQNRARNLMANSGNAKARALAAAKGRKTRMGKARLEITNWRTGQGYFYGIAQDAIDDSDYYDETFERMG